MNFTSWVFGPVDYDHNRPLLIDASNPHHALSYTELKRQVRQLVAGLRSIGVQPGDCVCINAFNNISYTVVYLAVIGAGAIFSGVNPSYSLAELVDHIDMVKAKFIIAEPKMLNKTISAATSCGVSLSHILALDIHESSLNSDVQSWSTLLHYGECDFETILDPENTVASYQTSSGTSGLPKAAMISHSYLIHQAQLRMTSGNITYQPRRLTALPPMHVFATPLIPASIREGVPTYVMRRYEQSEFIRAIEKYRISETWLAPPPIIAIPKSNLACKSALQSLRQIWFGGGAVKFENQLLLYKLLHPEARINAVWGMTEVGWVTSVQWPKKQINDSVGSQLDGYRLRVVDDTGHVLQQSGSVGELQIMAPHPMLGYLSNPGASGAAFTVDVEGRWVNSGDIGCIDDEGDVFIVDRKKDLIKVRGWQVSPAEVECRLHQHPDVLDVGVIGISASDGEGELVRAYVVRQCDSFLTESQLKVFSCGALAKYKCPDQIVFTESIPRNATGKILRRILREQAVRSLS